MKFWGFSFPSPRSGRARSVTAWLRGRCHRDGFGFFLFFFWINGMVLRRHRRRMGFVFPRGGRGYSLMREFAQPTVIPVCRRRQPPRPRRLRLRFCVFPSSCIPAGKRLPSEPVPAATTLPVPAATTFSAPPAFGLRRPWRAGGREGSRRGVWLSDGVSGGVGIRTNSPFSRHGAPAAVSVSAGTAS